MATVQRFEVLEVWQLARALEKNVFKLTSPEIFHNDFDLIRQMRRSSGSVMDNIAEGFGRSSRLEFLHALSIAKGEVSELKTQCYRAMDRQYIPAEIFENIAAEIELLAKKIGSFMNYLNDTTHRGQSFSIAKGNPTLQPQTPLARACRACHLNSKPLCFPNNLSATPSL